MPCATLFTLLCLFQSGPQSGPASRGDELRRELASAEPFRIAWAAARAQELSARWLCDALPRSLETLHGLPASDERLIATATVLDAMIQLGCPADSAALRRTEWFGEALRAQALILASRQPAQCVEFLRELRPAVLSDVAWLATTNILLTADPVGTTRLLARETCLRLAVTVHDPGRAPERAEHRPRGSRGHTTHGVPVPRGWPDLGRYELVSGRIGGLDALGEGPTPVGFKRNMIPPETGVAVEFTPPLPPYRPLDREQYRLACLWRLAGHEDNPPWQATTQLDAEWSDLPAHRAFLEEQSGQLRTAWRQLMDRLVQRGRLRPDPRDDLRPPVFVEVIDQRRHKVPPLDGAGR